MKVQVKIYGVRLPWTSKVVELEEDKRTARDLIAKLFTLGIPEWKYDEIQGKRVHFFKGMIMLRNGHTIGVFNENGFKATANDETFEDGDNVTILFPVAGG